MIILKEEARHLVRVNCYYVSTVDTYVFKFKGNTISLQHIDDEELAKVFRKVKMKDEQTFPRSKRGKTYAQMVQAIKDGTDKQNFIWSTYTTIFTDLLRSIKASY